LEVRLRGHLKRNTIVVWLSRLIITDGTHVPSVGVFAVVDPLAVGMGDGALKWNDHH